MTLQNRKLDAKAFREERAAVLTAWPTGAEVNLDEGIRYHHSLPGTKSFAKALRLAEEEKRTLLQPRAGVALVDEHVRLLERLQPHCDLLPTTIDAYTRQNRYDEAARGIEKSRQAGHSLLNGFPAVNHGVAGCRRVVEGVEKPAQIRHGTPDARLLAEITLAAGFTAFEGGGVSYNVPYAKKVPLERSLRDWQYVDRLAGLYQDEGIAISREPFGPLSGTLVPPCISHAVGLIEGLLALEQGVRCISLGYGQGGNLVQDVAAVETLRELGHRYFRDAGFDGYELTTVLHQWMGGFPEDESKAAAVIAWGGAVAALAEATKVITKTPHEAVGVPTPESNVRGLRTTAQLVHMLHDQRMVPSAALDTEKEILAREVDTIMKAVHELGERDLAVGAVRAFEAGVIDVPFAPSVYNAGKLLPCRDDTGAVRILDRGGVPMEEEVLQFHQDRIAARAKTEGRDPSFQMVIDDIYAISKGRLVGRPRT
jgi:methylaspartate mutase epsilon subunit